MAAAVAGSVHAQTAPEQAEDREAPVQVWAEQITGRPDREVNLEGDVEIVRGQTRMKASTACYRAVEDEVSAAGNVQMWRFGDRYRGDELKLNLDSGEGYVLRPQYWLEMNNAQGQATRMDFLSEDVAVVIDGTYSTCQGPNPDWYLKADTLRLDAGRDVGMASRTVVYFKGVPIIGAPALSFSLSGARRSGWLPPSVGLSSKGDSEVTLPYYFNIAPNRDLTLTPRLIASRGLMTIARGRYLGETYAGETQAELLLDDKQTDTDRWQVNSHHTQVLAPNWTYGWNVRAASDDQYPSDFSKSINSTAERQLLRELRTDYVSKYWSMTVRAQGYQVLQDPDSRDVPRPYDRLPQANFRAARYDVGGFDWALDAEATRFSHPDDKLVQGARTVVHPQVSYPFVRPGYFITPKVMLHSTKYQLDKEFNNRREYSRTLPTFSLDSGMVFEREASLLGSAVTQTLEPRLFYVYTPYKDQSLLPNFDTAETGFNFAQIFTENRFIGADRISDANQITAAVVSRFIESSGAERLRVALGQRFYFKDQRVTIDRAAPDVSAPRNESRSDVLFAASGRITPEWNFDSAVQYNASTSHVYSSNYGVQWIPGEKKVVNAEYRYLRDSFKNVDLSSQWPIARRWYGVGRVSYSLRDRKLIEGLVGLEYRADCWVFRMGAQRFVTAAQQTSTPAFFQLELNGLSKLGFGSPLESFYRSIPGYTSLSSNGRR